MKIAQILQNAGVEPKNGEINMGTVNGWTDKWNNLYSALKEYRIDGTGTERSLGRCYNEYSFTISDGIDEYNLVYSVDSGD